MGPLRLVLIIVFTVIMTTAVYMTSQVVFYVADQISYALYGKPFDWNSIPAPFGPVLRDLWNNLAPNLFLVILVMMVIVEFVTMFRSTTEGYQQVVWGG
jgi:hypothetical protein